MILCSAILFPDLSSLHSRCFMRWLLHLAFAWELFCLAVKNILLCVLGTVGFCVVLNVPHNKIFSVIIGAFACSLTFEMLFEYTLLGIFASTLTAVVVAHTYSEIAARILKTPSTVILIPSTVPLLPGGYLFYAMSNLVTGDKSAFIYNARQTALVAFAIALGSVITLIVLNIIRRIKAVLQRR